ncbi:MAG: GxxExxY protein [Candidatus Marinimicrobia bacterium]|nr:GxxExxY protein [Candidatus Neomarinimicrobiota bacterium]
MSYRIVGCAMEVHKVLGAGFLESVYEEVLKVEFRENNISYESQKSFPVIYKNVSVKDFVCDLVVDEKIIVELKAIKKISDIERAQVLNYLKVTGYKLGLLINFGQTSLKFERLVN